jgi:hypothetical protein
MARAWRIEYEGALYHVLSRGNEQRPIFIDNDDRLLFLETLGEMSERFEIDIFYMWSLRSLLSHFLERKFPQIRVGFGVFNRHAHKIALCVYVNINIFDDFIRFVNIIIFEFDMGCVCVRKIFDFHLYSSMTFIFHT